MARRNARSRQPTPRAVIIITLATLNGPPVQLDTVIPLNAGRSVSYWARVCDEAGYCRESGNVTVSVYP